MSGTTGGPHEERLFGAGFPFSKERHSHHMKRSLSFRFHHLYRWLSPGHSYLAAVAENRILRRLPFFVSDLPDDDVQNAKVPKHMGEDEYVATSQYQDQDGPAAPGARVGKGAQVTSDPTDREREDVEDDEVSRAQAQRDRFEKLSDVMAENHRTFVPDTPTDVVAKVGYVKLSNGTDFINTLIIHRKDDHGTQDRKTLVVCHGFGAGLAYFYKNYGAWAKAFVEARGWRVYGIDWLGMGRSSRAAFPRIALPAGAEGEVADSSSSSTLLTRAHAYFVDSLDDWRETVGISSMILVGHSLGGYLSGLYALKHEHHVEHLLLVSPVGIPPKPEGYVFGGSSGSAWFTLAAKLWDANFTVQGIVRALGPIGPRMIRGYAQRRLGYLPPAESLDMQGYIYNIMAEKGAENAITYLLEPGAWAREPLASSLPQLSIPVTFLYGDVDWMDYTHAEAIKTKLKDGTVHVLPNAGHHLYLDNPAEFNRVFIDAVLQKAGAVV